jgi:hypothetical protein
VHWASRGPFLRHAKIFWIAPAVFESSEHLARYLAKYLASCAYLASIVRFFWTFRYSARKSGPAAAVFRNLRRDLAFRQGHSANPVASLLLTGQV